MRAACYETNYRNWDAFSQAVFALRNLVGMSASGANFVLQHFLGVRAQLLLVVALALGAACALAALDGCVHRCALVILEGRGWQSLVILENPL